MRLILRQPGSIETAQSAQAVDRLAHFPHGLLHPHKKSAGYNRMADVQLMQARDASQQLFQILVIDAMEDLSFEHKTLL